MKINFDDKSYLGVSIENDKIIISLAAKDSQNPNKKIVNSVEISKQDFDKLANYITSNFSKKSS